MTDLDIARAVTPEDIVDLARQRLGIAPQFIEPWGNHKAKLSEKLAPQLADSADGKLILVSAMTPTPAGEGKTTTTIGVADALAGRSQTPAQRSFWRWLSADSSRLASRWNKVHEVNTARRLLQRVSQLTDPKVTRPVESLLEAVSSEIEKMRIQNVKDILALCGDHFGEPFNAIDLLWEERPDLRGLIAKNLFDILPPEDLWKDADQALFRVGAVLKLARDDAFNSASKIALLDRTYRALEAHLKGWRTGRTSAGDLMDQWALGIMFWNARALTLFLTKEEQELARPHTNFRELVFEYLQRVVIGRGNHRKGNFLQLLGGASVLWADPGDRKRLLEIASLRRAELSGQTYLVRDALNEYNFVSCFLRVAGANLVSKERANLLQRHRQQLLKKAEELPNPD
ncbi:MAG: formate--tetrahydrofolate ligase, partial [Proteobacteria bacterium]|nr:formate--tetrahydrofolate ligase [Pseudomonadota bacterium]